MPVHKKVAKAVKRVGKKAVRKALKFVGVRARKTAKKRLRAPLKKRLRRQPVASSISRAPKTVASSTSRGSRKRNLIGVAAQRGAQTRRQAQRALKGRGRKQVGPAKVGFRTVKGRGGRRITIKRPRPRLV